MVTCSQRRKVQGDPELVTTAEPSSHNRVPNKLTVAQLVIPRNFADTEVLLPRS
jgi:hypothetical protein